MKKSEILWIAANRTVLGSMLLVTLVGCGRPPAEAPSPREPDTVGIPSPAKPVTATTSPVPGKVDPAVLSAILETLPLPNAYAVKLDWHEGSALADTWILAREDKELQSKYIAQTGESVREFRDTDVIAGSAYQYKLWLKRNGEQLLHATANLTIPKDVEIRGTVKVKEITGVNRLFLRKESRLLPEGTEIKVAVNELHSEAASIESFLVDQTSEVNRPGRNGALIKIEAKLAVGVLFLNARGENGVNGTDGKNGAPGRDGEKGEDAVIRRTYGVGDATHGIMGAGVRYVTQQDLDRMYADLERALPGCHGEHKPYWTCERPAKAGGDATHGERGQNAVSGTSGGHSSPVFLRIHDASKFEVRFSADPGRASTAGKRGAGGLGGRGGNHGTHDRHCICQSSDNRGRDGKRAPDGEPGKDGTAGARGPACFKLGQVTMGECTVFTADGDLLPKP